MKCLYMGMGMLKMAWKATLTGRQTENWLAGAEGYRPYPT